MNIEYLQEKDYESNTRYIEELKTIRDSIVDYCKVVSDDKTCVVGRDDNGVAMVINDDGELNRYGISVTDDGLIEYENEMYEYLINISEYEKEVVRVSNMEVPYFGRTAERLSYLPKMRDNDSIYLEYEHNLKNHHDLIVRTDVTKRRDLVDALNYSQLHNPNEIDFKFLAKMGLFIIRKHFHYYLDEENNYYLSSKFNMGNIHLYKPNKYDPKLLIKNLEENATSLRPSKELVDVLTMRDNEFNRALILTNHYNSYMSRH